MKKVLGTAKRTLAVLLSTAVILTSLPQAGLSAYAAPPDDSITEDAGITPPLADFSDVEAIEDVGETTGDDETVSEGNASEDSNKDANADETDNNAADDEGAADTETNDAESKDSDVEDTDIEDADSEDSQADNSNSNGADAEEEIFAEVNYDGDEVSYATVTIPIPYDNNGGKRMKPGTAANLYISKFMYATGDGMFEEYKLPSTINEYFELDNISIQVPLNEENPDEENMDVISHKGTLRFKVVMADNYRLDGVWNESSYEDVTPNEEDVYELTISGNTTLGLNHSRLYPVIFDIDDIDGDTQILYRYNDEDDWKEAESGETIIFPFRKTLNWGQYQDQNNILQFRIIPGEGLVVRTPSANSPGMSVIRASYYDDEETNARGYYLEVKSERNLNESTKVFVTVEEPNDYTLKFDYPEDVTSVSVRASDGETTDDLVLTDKSVKVNEQKNVYFSVELNDTSKTILVQYENDEEIATLSADEINDNDSDGDGTIDSIIYEYSLFNLISDTAVRISVVDNYKITFVAPYGINGLEIMDGDDWYGLDFEHEDEEGIATGSVNVSAGSQLDFTISQVKYDHAKISIDVDGNNGDKVTSRYDEDSEWGPIYTFIPTGNATITFGIEPAEFIFDYDENEVELYVYDTDSEDGEALELSENKSINGGYDRSLRIKVRPIGENKRVDLRYNSWDGATSPYYDYTDDDGYSYYDLSTGEALDLKLTIVCYDICTITFETDGDAGYNISFMRVNRYYDDWDEEYYWADYEDEDSAFIADIGREYYFKTNYFNPENYKQSCTVTTGDTTEPLEVYDYSGDRWSETKEPVYCLIPTGDTTVTINRAELKTYEVNIVTDDKVTYFNSNYYSNDLVNVKENHLYNLYEIEVEEGYTASVTYTVGDGELQDAKALYGEYRPNLTGIYYSIEITDDTTIYISTELTSSYDVTFENADDLGGVKIWAAGTYSLEDSDELEGNKISLKNNNLYYFSITPKDGKLIDSVVCINSDTETVLEKTTYFFEPEGLTLDCYALGGGACTIKVNLSDGYTIAFDTTDFDTGKINVYSRSDYYYDEDYEENVHKNITLEKIGLPLNAGYSFFVINDSDYRYDVSVDSDAVVLTKSFEYINDDYEGTTVYTVSPKIGAELPKKVTVSITKRISETHNITVNYPDTIRSVTIGSYDDDGYYDDYRVKSGAAISVDSSVYTLRLVPVNSYKATVTIQGESDAEAVALTPYRNNMGEKEYYIGSVTEDMTITVETSKGIWQPAYNSVGFLPKRAQIVDSKYKTPFESVEYDEEDPDSEYYIDESGYPYYVTRGQSISFYANPYYGYAVESVYAAGVEVTPEWDKTLFKYVYTVTPTKNTLIVVNTVKMDDPNAPVDPDNPDKPNSKYDVTFTYPETVTEITFKNNAYNMDDNKITVKSGTVVAFKPVPTKGYKISSVKANDNAITADTDGYYSVTVSAATGIVISAVKDGTTNPDPDADYDVTFSYTEPETVTGITFKNNAYTLNDNKITVKLGTEVVFKPTLKDGYKISSVKANNKAIMADSSGYYTVTVSAATEIVISAVTEGTIIPEPVAEYDVTFTYPNTVTGITFKNDSYTLTDNKIIVTSGTKVAFKPVPADGYKISSVKANGSTITASSDGYYTVEVTLDTAIVIAASKESTSGGITGDGSGLKITLVEGENHPYTGIAITPAIEVTNNGIDLVEGIDYTVKYSNNVKVSTKSPAKVTVTGKGNLSGNASAEFKITERDIKDVDCGDIYVAENAKATIVLSYNGIKLGTKDFAYKNADDKNKKWTADGTITITGNGNFTGETDLDVKVLTKEAMKDAAIKVTLDNAANKNITYDGKEHHPVFTVSNKLGSTDLVENTDYIVSYPADVTSAGSKKFTIIGTSNKCVGIVSKSYTIKPAPKDATKVTVKVDNTAPEDLAALPFVSTGVTLDQAGTIEVTYDGVTKPLVLGTDYKITYSGNKKADADAKYTITGQGNYKGVKKTGTFKVGKASLNSVEIIVPDKLYTKDTAFKSTPVVIETATNTVLKTSNYKVTYCSDDQGTVLKKLTPEIRKVYVKIEGKGGYADSVKYESYEIKEAEAGSNVKDLSTAKIKLKDKDGKAKFYHTGEEVKPDVIEITYKDKSVDTLTLNEEKTAYTGTNSEKYDIDFVSNINKGKATVIIQIGENHYDYAVGGKTATYNVVAKSLKGFMDFIFGN